MEQVKGLFPNQKYFTSDYSILGLGNFATSIGLPREYGFLEDLDY